MQRLEVSGAVRPPYGPLGVRGLIAVELPVIFGSHSLVFTHR